MLADLPRCPMILRCFLCRLHQWRTHFCYLLFYTTLQCVLSCQTSNMLWSLPCHLSLAVCFFSCNFHGFFASIFATFATLFVLTLTLVKTPLSFTSSFADNLQSKVYNPLVSLLTRTFTIFFRCLSNLHWSTCVSFPVSGCRDCRCLVNDDVLQQREVHCTTVSFLGTKSLTGFRASIS